MKGTRVGILGLGLIGGSLALSLRGKRGAPEVWGCDRRKEFAERAKRDGAIARACTVADLSDCDLVIVCVPVLSAVAVVRRIGPRMSPGTVLTDAGSVKAPIVRVGREAVASGAEFVGGHPIAGTENSGYLSADGALFRGRAAIVTPTEENTEGALRRVERLWELAGARVLRMDPAAHDRLFAYVSHLPHVVAYALVHSVATLSSRLPLGYSAGGFRDFTRIASSNPAMWKDIVIQNRKELLRALRHYKKNLALLERFIRSEDAEGLISFFRTSKKTRDRL